MCARAHRYVHTHVCAGAGGWECMQTSDVILPSSYHNHGATCSFLCGFWDWTQASRLCSKRFIYRDIAPAPINAIFEMASWSALSSTGHAFYSLHLILFSYLIAFALI